MCLSSVQGAELRFPEPDRPKNPTMVFQRKPVIDEINRYTHVNIYIYINMYILYIYDGLIKIPLSTAFAIKTPYKDL